MGKKFFYYSSASAGLQVYTPIQYTDFDGVNDYWGVSNNNAKNHLLTNSTFTINLAIRLKTGFSGNQWVGFAWDGSSNQRNLAIGTDGSGKPRMLINHTGLASGNQAVTCNESLTANVWYFVTYQFNPIDGQSKIFINGVECTYSANASTSGTLYGTYTASLLFGGLLGNYANEYDLQFAAFYSDYKSSADISSMYNGGNLIVPSEFTNLIHLTDSNGAVIDTGYAIC